MARKKGKKTGLGGFGWRGIHLVFSTGICLALLWPMIKAHPCFISIFCELLGICGSPPLHRGPFLGGINWKPFVLTNKTTLTEGSEEGFPVRRLTFKLPEPYNSVGFQQPLTNIKVRLPGWIPKSKTYSLSNHPREGSFDMTVKIYDEGVVSKYLDSVQVGETVKLTKTRGKVMDKTDKIAIFAYGVGAAEVGWPIRELLSEDGDRNVKLFVMTKTLKDLFNRPELDTLVAAFPKRLEIYYFLSQEDPEAEGLRPTDVAERLSKHILMETLAEWAKTPDEVRFWTLGTGHMKSFTSFYLKLSGFPDFQDVGMKQGKGHLLSKGHVCGARHPDRPTE